MLRRFLLSLLPGACLGVVCIVGAIAGYRINLTSSAPLGLWKRTDVAGARYVTFCLPYGAFARVVRARGYVPYGTCPLGLAPLLKPVAAQAEDVVTVTQYGLAVNERKRLAFQILGQDQKGRPLSPFPFGSYLVAAGSIWVLSTSNPYSLDSRYFGPIAVASIISGMEPIAVWNVHAFDVPPAD